MLSIILLITAQLFGLNASADPVTPAVANKPLFTAHEVLNLSLSVDFDTMCRPNEVEDCRYTPTTLTYTAADGVEHSIPVEIRVRGGWRARQTHCKVPPLFMRFSPEQTEGTPFSGQNLLPLTTHCRIKSRGRGSVSGREYEQYVLREYLGYRLYNMLSDRSLRVRLLRINYTNPADSAKPVSRFGFFAEHFDDMAARQRSERLPSHSFDHEKIDLKSLDRVALFNFMIGNTDWSAVRQRNIVLIATDDGLQYPVPFDLDMSGLVDAEYSGVSPRLDFRDPKQRHYLGFCHPQADLDPLLAQFGEHKKGMLALVEDIPGMSNAGKKQSRNYLKKFFRILESPKRSQKVITNACYPWPPSLVDHTTPPDAQ